MEGNVTIQETSDGDAVVAPCAGGSPRDELAWQKLILECQTEAATDGILVVGPRGEVLVINAAFREMWEIGEAHVRVGDHASTLRALMRRVLAQPSGGDEPKAARHEESGRFCEQLALRDGREISWTSSPMVDRAGTYHGRVNYYADVTRHVYAEREAVANETRTRLIIDGAGDAIVSCDDDLNVLYINRCAESVFGWRREDVLWHGFDQLAVAPESRDAFVQWLRGEGARDPGVRAEFQFVRRDGRTFPAECSQAQRGDGPWVPITLFSRDVSDARRLEAELRQAQKLESVGRLAAGIAHEINTPVQFVGDSLHFLREAAGDLFRVLAAFRGLREAPPDALPGLLAAAMDLADGADLDFLSDQVPKALDRAADGIQRVASIVRGMKEFSHPDQKEKAPADLNRALRTTLALARNEYKLVADVDTELGEVPAITCHIGELNQVFLNIIVNAAHAIGDVVAKTGARGLIRVKTWCADGSAWVAIGDTGGGIPEAIRDKVFEPFFTTKEVGRGTGQGLAIARSVVVDKHGGSLGFDSVVGQGTTFSIRLPL